jgi:hypothetical protein
MDSIVISPRNNILNKYENHRDVEPAKTNAGKILTFLGANLNTKDNYVSHQNIDNSKHTQAIRHVCFMIGKDGVPHDDLNKSGTLLKATKNSSDLNKVKVPALQAVKYNNASQSSQKLVV